MEQNDGFFDIIASGIGWLSGFIWGWPLVIALLGTHIYLTWRLKFIQLYLTEGIKLTFAHDKGAPGDVSQFGSFCIALASTFGTGNIVGVATAIALGGPGAIFWMWIAGVFGIATKYAECLLAVKYRVRTEDGTMAGGPMYVLQYGLGMKWLGVLFAIFTALSAFGIGGMVQSNAVAEMLQSQVGVPTVATGAALAVFIGFVSVLGIRFIAVVCSWIVPFMAIFYVISCLAILVLTAGQIPSTLALIVTSAFTGHAAVGGFVGVTIKEAIRFGVARGLFSNEAGMGSAPMAAASAETKNCVRQALLSSTGVFWDTIIICALTGIVIINSGCWTDGLNGGALAGAAFNKLLPKTMATIVLVVSVSTFAASTILGWLYYSGKAVEYLVGKVGIFPYYCFFVLAVFLGAVVKIDVVWDFADLVNALMVIPNLIGVILLSKVVIDETDKYLRRGDLDADSYEPVPDYDTSKHRLLTPEEVAKAKNRAGLGF